MGQIRHDRLCAGMCETCFLQATSQHPQMRAIRVYLQQARLFRKSVQQYPLDTLKRTCQQLAEIRQPNDCKIFSQKICTRTSRVWNPDTVDCAAVRIEKAGRPRWITGGLKMVFMRFRVPTNPGEMMKRSPRSQLNAIRTNLRTVYRVQLNARTFGGQTSAAPNILQGVLRFSIWRSTRRNQITENCSGIQDANFTCTWFRRAFESFLWATAISHCEVRLASLSIGNIHPHVACWSNRIGFRLERNLGS